MDKLICNDRAALSLPVDNVGQQVVVPEPVLDVDLLVVHSQRTIKNASLLKFKLILS